MTWIVKHLRDLRSGKPETDVSLFTDEASARAHIAQRHGDFSPWPPVEDDVTEADPTATSMAWALGDPSHPDEYVELEAQVPRGPAADSYVLIDDENAGLCRLIGPMTPEDAEACHVRLEDRAGAWGFIRKRVCMNVGTPEPEATFHKEWTCHPGDILSDEHVDHSEPLVDQGGELELADEDDGDPGDPVLEYPEGSGG